MACLCVIALNNLQVVTCNHYECQSVKEYGDEKGWDKWPKNIVGVSFEESEARTKCERAYKITQWRKNTNDIVPANQKKNQRMPRQAYKGIEGKYFRAIDILNLLYNTLIHLKTTQGKEILIL